MKALFPLVLVAAVAGLSTPLNAGIFDRLDDDSAAESIPLNDGGGEAVAPSPEAYVPAPSMDNSYSGGSYAYQGQAPTGYGYPFKTGCCQPHNPHAAKLWRGYCGRSHGSCGHGCKGGFGCKGTCGKGGYGKGGCATGNCGHHAIGFGKGLGHVQHKGHVQHSGHVQHAPIKQSHVQRGSFFGGHVQHGKGHVGCNTCGQSPCGCHAQKGLSFGFHGKHLGHGFAKGHIVGDCGCGPVGHGKGFKPHCSLGLFGHRNHCDTCGKSAGFGFGKGGCDCGGATVSKGWSKGWSQEGGVIWDQDDSYGAPQPAQPTPANDPPAEFDVPNPADSLPVPPTPTGHSASLRWLPGTLDFQY